jgi:hypothetical protein
MSDLKLLPILRIHDTDFYVDMEKLEFRQVDNDKNAISFYDVQDNGDHTQIIYDPKTKNAFQGSFGEMMHRDELVVVKLPPAIELDTQYIADQLVKNLHEKYHGGIRRTDDNGNIKRPWDRPDIVRIYDADFYLDLEKLQFRQVGNETNRFSFSKINENGDQDLVYDPQTKNVFKGTFEERLDRDDLILVKLPNAVREDINARTGQFTAKFKDDYMLRDKHKSLGHLKDKSKRARGI